MMIKYFIWDFLLDEKKHLDILQSELKKLKQKGTQPQKLLKVLHEIESIQLRARQMYLMHKQECPVCVWNYFTGRAKKVPSHKEIIQVLKQRIKRKNTPNIILILEIIFAIWVVYTVSKTF